MAQPGAGVMRDVLRLVDVDLLQNCHGRSTIAQADDLLKRVVRHGGLLIRIRHDELPSRLKQSFPAESGNGDSLPVSRSRPKISGNGDSLPVSRPNRESGGRKLGISGSDFAAASCGLPCHSPDAFLWQRPGAAQRRSEFGARPTPNLKLRPQGPARSFEPEATKVGSRERADPPKRGRL